MPYIIEKRREVLNPLIDKLLNELETDGEVNFAITRIIDGVYINRSSYSRFNSAMGVLECVKQEYYRRRIGNYEDSKIVQNGDVFK